MVQLSTPYIDPECHSAQRHRRTNKQTDGLMTVFEYDADSRSYCHAQYDRLKALVGSISASVT